MRKLFFSFLILPLFVAAQISCAAAQSSTSEGKESTKAATSETTATAEGKQVATLAGGCFWCTEAIFKELRGVERVESGYSGGSVKNPTYEQVSSGTTGHAEVIQITFDPTVVSFKELLEVFFVTHDPTTLDRQGADIGTQYRSAVFYHSKEQKKIAEEVIKDFTAQKLYPNPIVTKLEPFNAFYKAEEYHQNYYERNPEKGYCRIVIEPKVLKFRKQFINKLKKTEQSQ
ncbi:MAG: peptide-methionine (S)-S-oxide reductase MsrA [Acidobacteriota bacterium]